MRTLATHVFDDKVGPHPAMARARATRSLMAAAPTGRELLVGGVLIEIGEQEAPATLSEETNASQN
jgi:hypothetical protein